MRNMTKSVGCTSLIVRYPRVFEPLRFSLNLVEDHVKKSLIKCALKER